MNLRGQLSVLAENQYLTVFKVRAPANGVKGKDTRFEDLVDVLVGDAGQASIGFYNLLEYAVAFCHDSFCPDNTV